MSTHDDAELDAAELREWHRRQDWYDDADANLWFAEAGDADDLDEESAA
jgi:hypothetical protein